MANAVNYLSQIQTGQTIQAVHVNQFVNALSGSEAYDLTISGSLTVIGPLNATASLAISANTAVTASYVLNAVSSSFASTASFVRNAVTASYVLNAVSSSFASTGSVSNKPFIASNASSNVDYTLIFKNDAGALNDYYQLAADGTNGPYYNPSTNILGGLGGLTVSGSIGSFTSITGSVLGNVNGTASFATTASYALTSSFASNGVTNLAVGTFIDTTTQTITTGTSASLQLNTPIIQDGVSIASNSRITVSRTGIYNLQFSAQLETPGGGSPDVHIWLRKNLTNIANTNTGVTMQNSNQKIVAGWNFVESLIAGDFLELVAYLDGGSSVLFLAEGPLPANGGVGVPSLIVTMTQIK